MNREEVKYSKAIGKKFNEDGTPRLIPGNTFISMVDHNSGVFNHLLNVCKMLNEASFYKKYIELPPDSYHMTVIEGVIPKFSEQVWTSHLPKDTKLEEIDQYFREQLAKVEPMTSVVMKCQHMRMSDMGCTIELVPNSPEDKGILSKYRDQVADACGLRFSNHDNYGFHISLSYLWKELNEEELRERDETVRKINEYLVHDIQPFTMPPAKLVYFNTMFRFEEVRH